MVRIAGLISVCLLLLATPGTRAGAQGVDVNANIPESVEGCLTTGLNQLFGIGRSDQEALFRYFLSNIDFEQFGRYNYKRAWLDWGNDVEIKRLAVYEYFSLMAGRRGEHQGDTTSFEARLADHPAVKGDNIYHIIARANFEGGSSTTIVLFTNGCNPFGFMYGGANLRSFVNADLIEKQYRSGKRAPF